VRGTTFRAKLRVGEKPQAEVLENLYFRLLRTAAFGSDLNRVYNSAELNGLGLDFAGGLQRPFWMAIQVEVLAEETGRGFMTPSLERGRRAERHSIGQTGKRAAGGREHVGKTQTHSF